MNTPNDPKRPWNPREAAEWAAQETALEQERRGQPLDRANPRVVEYRLIARALRNPAMEPVPFDLTAQIVRQVAGTRTPGERIESWLLRGLAAVFAVAAIAAVAHYGPDWLPAFARLWPQWSAQSSDWSGLLVGCIALSLAWQGIIRLARDRDDDLAVP